MPDNNNRDNINRDEERLLRSFGNLGDRRENTETAKKAEIEGWRNDAARKRGKALSLLAQRAFFNNPLSALETARSDIVINKLLNDANKASNLANKFENKSNWDKSEDITEEEQLYINLLLDHYAKVAKTSTAFAKHYNADRLRVTRGNLFSGEFTSFTINPQGIRFRRPHLDVNFDDEETDSDVDGEPFVIATHQQLHEVEDWLDVLEHQQLNKAESYKNKADKLKIKTDMRVEARLKHELESRKEYNKSSAEIIYAWLKSRKNQELSASENLKNWQDFKKRNKDINDQNQKDENQNDKNSMAFKFIIYLKTVFLWFVEIVKISHDRVPLHQWILYWTTLIFLSGVICYYYNEFVIDPEGKSYYRINLKKFVLFLIFNFSMNLIFNLYYFQYPETTLGIIILKCPVVVSLVIFFCVFSLISLYICGFQIF